MEEHAMFLPVANGSEEIAPLPPFHRSRCSASWWRLKKGRNFLLHVAAVAVVERIHVYSALTSI